MSAAQDVVSPAYIREKRIDLTLDTSSESPDAFDAVIVNVGVGRCAPEGLVLPLVLEIQGPSPESYQRRIYYRDIPSSVIFRPQEGGAHLVTLKEAAHNRWWGSLRVTVSGAQLTVARPL